MTKGDGDAGPRDRGEGGGGENRGGGGRGMKKRAKLMTEKHSWKHYAGEPEPAAPHV